MRVRLQRPTERRAAQRRPHILAHVNGANVAAPAAPAAAATPPPAEHRHRAAGPPEDHATYGCACGLVFAAAVSTTVMCPNCGAGQAW